MNWDTNLKNMWYIYILECSDGTYYCGITNNFHKRMDDHNSGKGAKYTRGRTPVKPVYWNIVENKSEALKIEYKIKQYTRKQKEELIKYKVYPEYIFNYCDNLYYMKDEKLYIWGLVGEEEKEEWIEFVSEEMKKIYLRNKKLKRILK
jgi:putative endonuclease